VTYSEDDFRQESLEIRDELYSANGADGERLGRFHLGIRILLNEYPLNDEDIAEQVLDDHNDQGIDFFLVLGGAKSEVCIVQVKDNVSLDRAEQLAAVRKMVGEIHELMSKLRVGPSWPEKRKERYRDLKSLWGDEHQLRYVLLLTNDARAESLEDDVKELLEQNEVLEIIDRKALAAKEEENLSPRKPRVTLRLQKGQFFEIDGAAGAKVLVTHVNAHDYVEATEAARLAIFRLNPRLYLGDKPSNKGMLNTLRNDRERERFHLLNNGITVVCESYAIENESIKAEDFQVVNGCQTTETLWKYNSEEPEKTIEVYVPLRIIETQNNEALAGRISQTTNSQSAVASSDLVSNDSIQKDIKTKLSVGSPAIFYEARRGELRQLKKKNVERNKFRVDPGNWGVGGAQGFREIGLKEFAQIMLAVNKSPSNAKEQISSLFEKREPGDLYSKLFKDSWTDPVQLQLLVEAYFYIRREENWCKGRTDDIAKERGILARLGRFYVLYLVYRQWRIDKGIPHNPDDDEPSLLPAQESADLLRNFVSSIGNLPDTAVRALEKSKKSLKLDTRDLLRRKAARIDIEDKFDDLLLLGD
jgi:hypothetical protein